MRITTSIRSVSERVGGGGSALRDSLCYSRLRSRESRWPAGLSGTWSSCDVWGANMAALNGSHVGRRRDANGISCAAPSTLISNPAAWQLANIAIAFGGNRSRRGSLELSGVSARTHPGLVEAAVLAAHAEGFHGRGRLLRHQQSLLQLDLLLQLHQHRRLHAVPETQGRVNGVSLWGARASSPALKHSLGDDAADLQEAETHLARLLVQHWGRRQQFTVRWREEAAALLVSFSRTLSREWARKRNLNYSQSGRRVIHPEEDRARGPQLEVIQLKFIAELQQTCDFPSKKSSPDPFFGEPLLVMALYLYIATISGLKHRLALQWHLNGSYYGTFDFLEEMLLSVFLLFRVCTLGWMHLL